MAMKRDDTKLLKDALSLPPEGRAALAGTLIESLDEEVDEDAEQAWEKEIRRRLREIDTGAVRLMSWADVRRRLRSAT
jgi:putative addiction module component (TIGR02574 family)